MSRLWRADYRGRLDQRGSFGLQHCRIDYLCVRGQRPNFDRPVLLLNEAQLAQAAQVNQPRRPKPAIAQLRDDVSSTGYEASAGLCKLV